MERNQGMTAGAHRTVCAASLKGKEMLNWDKAIAHLNEVIAQYESLDGTPGVNVHFVLKVVLRPLRIRYDAGDRTQELYDEMMATQ